MKQQQFIIILALIGIFLVLDGLLSLWTQWDEGWLFNAGRIIRAGIGILLLSVAFRRKRRQKR